MYVLVNCVNVYTFIGCFYSDHHYVSEPHEVPLTHLPLEDFSEILDKQFRN